MKFTAAYAVVTVAITATFVAASPTLQARGGQCNTGEINCCNKIAKKTDKRVHGLLSALGIAIEDVLGDIGSECSPIGAGGGSCNVEPVCCENNAFGSLISIG